MLHSMVNVFVSKRVVHFSHYMDQISDEAGRTLCVHMRVRTAVCVCGLHIFSTQYNYLTNI